MESEKSQLETRLNEEISRNGTHANGNHNGNGHHNGDDHHHTNGHTNGQTNGNHADVNGHQIEKRLEELEQVTLILRFALFRDN